MDGNIVKMVIEPSNAALHESGYWLQKFANFKPLDVHTVWNEHDHTIWGIVKFNEDWNRFMTTSNFEKSFETVNLGKRDWKERQSNPGLITYGWGEMKKAANQYVWPWMGIIVKTVIEPSNAALHESGYWLEKFANFKPLDVHTVSNEHDHTIWGIVKFNEDWNRFMTTSNFEKSFETVNLGKRDRKERQSNPGLITYGWGAHADDYTAEDPIGKYLHNSMIPFLKTS